MTRKFLLLSLICFSLVSFSACSLLPKADTEESTEQKKKKKKKHDATDNTDETDDEEEEVDNSDFEFIDLDVDLDTVNDSQKPGTYKRLVLKSTGYDKLEQVIDQLNEDAKASYEKNAHEDMYYQNEYYVGRADNQVFSIYKEEVAFGGETYSKILTSATYDSQTGKELSLSDIMDMDFDFEDIYSDFDLDSTLEYSDEFKSMIKNMLADEAQGNGGSDAEQLTAWFLGYNGVSIFAPIEVETEGAHYTKVVQFDIPYSKYPELYNKKYVAKPDEFAFSVAYNGEFYYDISGDGKPEHIKISADSDPETYFIGEYNIDIDGKVTTIATDEMAGYIINDFIFLKVGGKNYFMFNEVGDNDGRICRVIDLNKTEIVTSTDHEPYLSIPLSNVIVYNPKNMLLSNTIYTVSTLHVINHYEFGSDENFKAKGNSYNVESKLDFTSKIDLTVDVLSSDGSVAESTALPAGTHFYPYQTDTTTYTDYKLSDGRIVRIPMTFDENTGYGYTVQGVPIEDVFDGLVFAG